MSHSLKPAVTLPARPIAVATRFTRTWLALLCVLLTAPAAATEWVRYPQSFPGHETRDAYALELLQLALDKADSGLQIAPSDKYMEQSRALAELELSRSVDVVWTMTSEEREARLLPIRIGIDKGLMGWRIALLGKGQEQLLASVRNVEDLRAFSAGQGHDWPDRYILEQAQLPVVTSSSYPSLFLMLAAGRFDYFPRSLLELDEELKSQQQGLVADPYVLLHYPSASYFFVAKDNQKLADILHRGLEKAVADGSFDQLFFAYYGETLRRAKLDMRRLIELENPLLPAATPLQRSELWLSPEQLLNLSNSTAD